MTADPYLLLFLHSLLQNRLYAGKCLNQYTRAYVHAEATQFHTSVRRREQMLTATAFSYIHVLTKTKPAVC
jgi:hypothetical protein